ncbi:MAG: hypothetical protein CVU91_06105 [Firmicutes bacterium HGW-Firmicutes-16]|nr:MAG: hypothetical protein CVU91_06105 [Firmicutes bacterium HGW-Firmicutes-16]
MRNLSKFTAAVLAVTLVLTSMTAVFAADSATLSNADKAVTLRDLGLYSGQDANDPKVGLENALTTQDSLIFLAKLFGYYDAASKLTADNVDEALAKFDDAASIADYAKNVVAYSATNSVLSGSTQDGKFFVGAKDTVTAARFATFMLRQMGYTVADFRQSVATLAETKGSKIDATLTGDLTRDAAIGVMFGALTAEKASGKTVIVDIAGDNADLKAKAEKIGLIESISGGPIRYVQVELSVVSVKALNTKQVEIKFNAEMDKDSAQDEANYKIKDQGNVEKTLTTTSCKLGYDKRTVTITLDSTVQDCLTNASKAKVIVSKDIRAVNAKKLGADKEVEVEVQDGLLPTVKEVKAIGERTIKITFSEPVHCNNNTKTLDPVNFKVVSGTYEYYVQKAELNLDVITLEVGTKLVEGPVTLTVNAAGLGGTNAIQDYAGYKVFKGNTTFNYVKDTTVPVVTVKSARANKVVLLFSKPVKGSNIKLYHSDKTNEAYKAEATATDYADEITFTFNGVLPSGTLNLFLVNSEDGKLIDRYGITVPDQSLTCHVAIDTTAPVVTGCEVNTGESIKIVFNEELDIEVVTNPDSYVVKKLSDNKEIPFSVVLDESMKSVELIFSAELEDNTEYQLTIKKYQDISGNTNTSAYTYRFTTGDYKHPVVIDQHCCAVPEKGLIYIVYSEAMNEEQMLVKANYLVTIGGTYKDLGDNDAITKVNDRTVRIYFKELDDTNDSTIRPFVTIAPIVDLAGKSLYDSVEPYTVQSIDPENVIIEEAQLIAKNKFKIVFNKEMKSVSWEDIKLTNLTTPDSIRVVGCESTSINSDGKTEVVLILDKELATDVTDGEGAKIGITTIAAPSSESEWGSKLRSQSQFNIDLVDKTAPEIVMWNHDDVESTVDIVKVIGNLSAGTITIYFSEDIKESTLTVDTFNVTGFTITEITAPVETKTVVLTVKANAENTPVEITVNQVLKIYDTAGNALDPGSPWAVTLENITT